MTALDAIKSALRRLGVIRSGENLSPDEAADGLESLNFMLHRWELDGIRLNHIDFTLSSALPWPPNHREPIVCNLAVRLADEYGKSIPQGVLGGAMTGYTDLQNYYADPKDAQFDDDLVATRLNYYEA